MRACRTLRRNLANIHVFGCTSYTYVQNAKKLDVQSTGGIAVEYDTKSLAYLAYYSEVNWFEKVRCVKFQEQSISQPENEPEEEFLLTPVPRFENGVTTEQAEQTKQIENITENNDNTR